MTPQVADLKGIGVKDIVENTCLFCIKIKI